MSLKSIRRALISVSDKTDLIEFAKCLHKYKVEILSTGGTLKALRESGIPARAVEDFTGFPEILEGRVKTLHPKIHGGLLYRRDKKSHGDEAKKHGIEAIDLVVVNLYPFEQVTASDKVDLETAIENIDIGGPSMLRSAAKNHHAVTVVCDPSDYRQVMLDMETHKGATTEKLRQELAVKVFEKTSSYDGAISAYLAGKIRKGKEIKPATGVPAIFHLSLKKEADLRYGENPHQAAAYYVESGKKPTYKQLHGKELSFNNLLDMDATLDVIKEFEEPAACIIKHNNPCGLAEDENITVALEKAVECDSMSAFGGIIGINRPCDLETAQMAFDKLRFFEVFVAPKFEPKALAFLKTRQNLRLMEMTSEKSSNFDLKLLSSGGALLQTKDQPLKNHVKALHDHLRLVTKTKLSSQEIEDLFFAFKCVKVVKSNAIVITQGRQTVGIGAGQMSRIDSVEIACRKAGYRTEGGYLASDAFFPMPDSIETAAEHRIKAIIQPGGSLKDADVIAACDNFGIAMVLTGERHFRH